MFEKKSYTWPIVTAVIGLLLLIVALPQEYKRWAPGFLRNPSFHFGLDLAGGTQLDFRISERELNEQLDQIKMELETLTAQRGDPDRIAILQLQHRTIEEQKGNIVEAIRTVLERRINSMGVSEAIITPSYIGNEKHLLVECPGVVDVQDCIAIVGKTIKLEFKEELTEATDEFEVEVNDRAEAALARIKESGDTLHIVGQDLSDELGVSYQPEINIFYDDLPEPLKELWNRPPEKGPIYRKGSINVTQAGEDGTPIEREVPGIFIAEVTKEKTQEKQVLSNIEEAFEFLEESEEEITYAKHTTRALNSSVPAEIVSSLKESQPGEITTVELEDSTARILFLNFILGGGEVMEASHILVSYEGAVSAAPEVTRSKDEALQFAKDLAARIEQGEEFEKLARENSDGPSGEQGGSLGQFGRGDMVPQFEEVSFALAEGEISDPVETQFGYHLIRGDKAPIKSSDHATYDELIIEGENAITRANETVQKIKDGEIYTLQDQGHIRSLFFSLIPSGWKDTPLDGKHFRSASVTLDPTTNVPVVQITFDDEGGKMFGELTSRNVNKRIAIFVGGQLISAPVVQTEILGGTAIITGSNSFEEARALATDLNTGAIPAPIFLSGQRTVEATLGATALRTSIQAALIGVIILMLYMILIYKLLGLIADIALSLYAFLFFAFLKMPLFLFSSNYIVLTLAGMAGIILSIGMAVDANVLIFERIKEELRKGKLLKTAVRTGFERAWPSIRDGNASTFITCAILFMVGTSIIRGFAITLGTGLILSMFTAIVITRWLLKFVSESALADNTKLFGVKVANE